MYEAYFGVNPADPFSSLTDEGREKAMDYINLLHASGMYEKQTAKIIPFRSIDIFENAVSAGTGNFLVDGPKETVCIDESILPEDTTFGVRISGDSMEPEFHDGQIAWVLQQESVANGEIGIFALNGEAYIKKLQNDTDGIFLISLNEIMHLSRLVKMTAQTYLEKFLENLMLLLLQDITDKIASPFYRTHHFA